jgi:hypothetical protein
MSPSESTDHYLPSQKTRFIEDAIPEEFSQPNRQDCYNCIVAD